MLYSKLFVFSQQLPVRNFKHIRQAAFISLNYSEIPDSNVNVSVLPLYQNDLKNYFNTIGSGFFGFSYRSKSENDFVVKLNPIFDLIVGFSEEKKIFLPSTLGLMSEFALNNKLGFSGIFCFMKNDFDFFQSFKSNNSNIIYGIGNASNKYIFRGEWNLIYAPYTFLRFDFANSRNFYGYGYRSLLLSDFASSYPHLKMEADFLNFKYSFIWAKMISIRDNNFLPFEKSNKFSLFHLLDWRISRRVNIGIFESVVSKAKFFAAEYLNPVLFFRPVEFNLGSEDNVLLGLNSRFIISKKAIFYFQVVMDDIVVKQLINDIKHNINPNYVGEYGWFANKWGLQFGFKQFNVFGLEQLDFFSEFNLVRPYTYSHSSVEKNYTHLHQALAHPLGANFGEWLNGINYFNDKYYLALKYSFSIVGEDSTNTHYGSNIFLPTMDGNQGYPYIVQSYGNEIFQGFRFKQNSIMFEVGYFPVKSKNLSFSGIIYYFHKAINTVESQKYYFLLGIRSGLVNWHN